MKARPKALKLFRLVCLIFKGQVSAGFAEFSSEGIARSHPRSAVIVEVIGIAGMKHRVRDLAARPTARVKYSV